MEKKGASDYFAKASSVFLTEELDGDELNEILEEGKCLPVSEDYEDWDPDYLANAIDQVAELLAEAYNEGLKDGQDDETNIS